MTSLGIVIPAYRPDVRVLAAYIHNLREGLKPETIRVELDNPLSPEIGHKIAQAGATVAVSDERRGKGAAITAGFEALSTDIRMFLDADGSTPLTSAAAILQPIYDGAADVSAGSRRHPASTVTSHQTIARRYLGDSFATAARKSLPTEMYDYQCGAKALTAETWEQIRTHLYEKGFAWDLELIAVAGSLDLRVAEIPIVWEDKPGSTVDPIRSAIDMGRALVAVRHRSKAIDGHPVHAVLPRSRSTPLLSD